MITFWLTLLTPLAIVAGLVLVVVRRGLQMKLLVGEGVPATGRVVAKLTHLHPGRRLSPTRRIKYAYADDQGRSHEHISTVTAAFFNRHAEGGPIAIRYARNKPSVSAPEELVEQSRVALGKRS